MWLPRAVPQALLLVPRLSSLVAFDGRGCSSLLFFSFLFIILLLLRSRGTMRCNSLALASPSSLAESHTDGAPSNIQELVWLLSSPSPSLGALQACGRHLLHARAHAHAHAHAHVPCSMLHALHARDGPEAFLGLSRRAKGQPDAHGSWSC
jgi:hypothetical protein